MQINIFIFSFYQNDWEIVLIHKRIQVATEPTFDIEMYFTNQWAVAKFKSRELRHPRIIDSR